MAHSLPPWHALFVVALAALSMAGCSELEQRSAEVVREPRVVWTAAAVGFVVGATADRVVLTTGDGLVGLDMKDGREVWRVPDDWCVMDSGPALCHGTSEGAFTLVDPATGHRTPINLGPNPRLLNATASGFYTLNHDDEYPFSTLRLRSWTPTGQLRWEASTPPGEYDDPYFIAVEEYEGLVSLRAEGQGLLGAAGKVVIDGRDGHVVLENAFISPEGQFLRTLENGGVDLLDRDGTVLHSLESSPFAPQDDVSRTNEIVVSSGPMGTSAIGPMGVMWTSMIQGWGAECFGSTVLVSGEHEVTALSLANGRPLWTAAAPRFSQLQCRPNVIVATPEQVEGNEDAEPIMVALDPATGAERWRIPSTGPGLFTPQGVLVFDDSVRRVKLYA